MVTMVGDSTETSGATVRATKSSKVKAGATDVVLESEAQRPIAPEEQAARPKMP